MYLFLFPPEKCCITFSIFQEWFILNTGQLLQKPFICNFYGKRKQFLSMKVMQHSNLQNSSNLLNDFLVKGKHDYASSKASHQACNNVRQVISWNPSTVTIKRKGRSLSYIMQRKAIQHSVFVFGGSRFSSFVVVVVVVYLFIYFHLDTNDLRIGINLGLMLWVVFPAEEMNSR